MKNSAAGGQSLLKAQALHELSLALDQIFEDEKGGSEIEKLFASSLRAWSIISAPELFYMIFADDEREAELYRNMQSRPSLVVEQQFKIGPYRVDFLISGWTNGRIRHAGGRYTDVTPGWRKLVVECDGHEFHEKTKDQVARDKAREREIVSAGYEIFRFSGSEIWRNPLDCAGQISDWMVRGW